MAVAELTMAGTIARLTLDRPPLNVIDLGTARELAAALDAVAKRDDLALVVLEARGRAFSAGVDVRDHLPDRGAEMIHAFDQVCVRLLELETPTLAAVRGAALGGGCELTLMCDLVLASDRASFGQPEIRLGVLPPVAAVALPRTVAPHLAAEMLLTGRTLEAEEAHRAGLANRVVADGAFEASLEETIASFRGSSVPSLRATKQAMRAGRSRVSRDEIEAAERIYLERLLEAPDAIEGLTAFLEKRAPEWGRGERRANERGAADRR